MIWSRNMYKLYELWILLLRLVQNKGHNKIHLSPRQQKKNGEEKHAQQQMSALGEKLMRDFFKLISGR